MGLDKWPIVAFIPSQTKNNLAKMESIANHSTKYQWNGHSIELQVRVVWMLSQNGNRKTSLMGQVWIDDEEVEEAAIIPQGRFQTCPELPIDHSIVKEKEKKVNNQPETRRDPPGNVLWVPPEFHEQVLESFLDANQDLRERSRRLIDDLECKLSVEKRWVDYECETLVVEGELSTRIGTFPVQYRIGSQMEVEWSVSSDSKIPADHREAVYAAAHHKTPVTPDDYIGDVILESREKTIRGKGVTVIPVCQADGCEHDAKYAIPSPDGHPNDEWQLCEEHFETTGGQDPYRLTGKGWGLKKLKYRCTGCSRTMSHNLNIDTHSCDRNHS